MEVENNQIVLAPDEKPLMNNWKDIKIIKNLAVSHRIKEGLMVLLCIAAYALLAYYIPLTGDDPAYPLNNSVRIFFLPWFLYYLSSYRGLDKFILSLITGLILISGIYYYLLLRDIISWQGIAILYYPRNIILRVFENIDIAPPEIIRNAVLSVFLIMMGFVFLIYMLRRLFKKKQTVQLFLSDNNIYIRQPCKGVFFSILWTIALTILTPININNYREIAKKFRYRKASKLEGSKYDHASIPRAVIPKVKMSSSFNWLHILISAALIFAGVGISGPGIAFATIGFIWGVFSIRNYRKKLKNVKIKFSLESVSGSWILINPATEIHFLRLDPEFAPILLQYED